MAAAIPNLRQQTKRATHPAESKVVPLARLQRSTGSARVSFKARDGVTVLEDVHQSGCCKLRFPRPEPGRCPEAVLLNTAGGLTDGDRVCVEATWKSGTRATVTTQAAERIYKSRGGPAHIGNTLDVEAGATALWLPQETILFDRGRFERRLEASVAETGRLLACESIIFGRAAMGEIIASGALFDAWRVRYGGRLVFADGLRLEGAMQETLARPAVAGGARAAATVIYVTADAEAMLEPVRATLGQAASLSGCSVIGPVLVARLLAPSGAVLRRDLVRLLQALLTLIDDTDKRLRPAALPRVWSC